MDLTSTLLNEKSKMQKPIDNLISLYNVQKQAITEKFRVAVTYRTGGRFCAWEMSRGQRT